MKRWVLAVAVLGCGPPPAVDEPIDAAASSSGGSSSSSTSGVAWPTAPTTGTAATDSGADDWALPPPDTVDHRPCSTFTQDCPPGQKCVPWSLGGGGWNATQCVDVVPDAHQLDEPCTQTGPAGRWYDDCDVGLLCWNADPRGNGICWAQCAGDPSAPTCPEMSSCSFSSSGVIALCLPQCDPLAQGCPAGQACYPINDHFTCAPDASGDLGVHGDPCRCINSCDPGFICIGADAHTDCASGIGCCSTFCDHTDRTSDDACAALDPGQSCEAWFVAGMAPPEYENVGVCALPLGGG